MNMSDDIQKDIALLKQNDQVIEKTVQALQANQEQHMKKYDHHEQKDQERHLQLLQSHTEVRELIINKMNSIEKYVDIKVKEHQLRVEENYTKKIEHGNLEKNVVKLETDISKRLTKIETIFDRLWKIVFWFIVLWILAVLFDK